MTFYTFVNGEVADADEVNDNFQVATGWNRVIYNTNIDYRGIVKWTATRWQTRAGLTTDSGTTWTATGYPNPITVTSGAKGCSLAANGNSKVSSDSGATWGNSTTQPSAGGLTNGYCMSAFGDVMVVGGEAGASRSIFYSTDAGVNFTICASGPTDYVTSIVMCSALIGFALDFNKNIWRTADGGINWTDTTKNSNILAMNGRMVAISTDKIVIIISGTGNGTEVDTYVHSTTTVTRVINSGGNGLTKDANSSGILATNGNVYWVHAAPGVAGASARCSEMALYKYDGTSVYFRMLGEFVSSSTYPNENWYNDPDTNLEGIYCLIEVSNILYLVTNNNIIAIDVTGDI